MDMAVIAWTIGQALFIVWLLGVSPAILVCMWGSANYTDAADTPFVPWFFTSIAGGFIWPWLLYCVFRDAKKKWDADWKERKRPDDRHLTNDS